MSESITTSQKVGYIIRVLNNARGDDLERAKAAFSRYSVDEMNVEHGSSGQSRSQILQGYEYHRKLHDASVAYLEPVLLKIPSIPKANHTSIDPRRS